MWKARWVEGELTRPTDDLPTTEAVGLLLDRSESAYPPASDKQKQFLEDVLETLEVEE